MTIPVKSARFLVLVAAMLINAMILRAQKETPVVVDVDHPAAEIQPTMWGIFFEDINFAADGGLYAELIKNRSFEFIKPLMGWNIVKKDASEGLLVLSRGNQDVANPRFIRVSRQVADGRFGLENEGFRGMGIKKGVVYHFSLYARNASPGRFPLRVELQRPDGSMIASVNLAAEGQEWKRYSADMTAGATEPKAKLTVWFEGEGSLDLDMVSLFPGDTWRNHPGGLRSDLVQLLADLKPGFIRFPGGCIVEGYELASRYQWKNTIGDIRERKTMINRWNTEFKHRLTPDYFQSFGLGFYEYFLLAEELGAEPLPILNCGMACQYNSAELAPMDQLEPYIQDAIDLVEFANGPAGSPWGKIRAGMGHPAPFNLKMIGIGNEQWGAQYFERYQVFANRLKEKIPGIRLVSGAGPSPSGKFFDYAVKELTRLNAQIVDEHYYASPDWFLKNAARYDTYPRNGYRIFAGEYAAHPKTDGTAEKQSLWKSALAEAAFMTGLERNAEVVNLCSYAPLFAHLDAWQWAPNLIWFDNLRSFGTTSYYVQKLFSTNRGTNVLPMNCLGKPLTGQDELYGSAVFDRRTGEVILKLVNTSGREQSPSVKLVSRKGFDGKQVMTLLHHPDAEAFNSLENPEKIFPKQLDIVMKGRTLKPVLPPGSLAVIRLKLLK